MREMVTRPCPHCRVEVEVRMLSRHIAACIRNPAVYEPLIDFLCQHADHKGRIMTEAAYQAIHAQYEMPSAHILRYWIGSWKRVATWAGLKRAAHGNAGPVREADPDKSQDMSPLNAPNPPRIGEIREYAWSGMDAYPALRCVRVWVIGAQEYRPIGWQRVYAIR